MNEQTKKETIIKLTGRLNLLYAKLGEEDLSISQMNKTFNEIKELKLVLDELKGVKKRTNWADKIDVNVLINAGIGLIGIMLILNYEKTEVLTSKSISLAQKLIGR